ncbi:MAG: transglutaminase domain-containing protein, partial [Microbacteriaceae bacterium]
ATTEYAKAVALQNYFQDDGFVYSTTAPVHNSYDGDSMQSIAAFLTVKSGYCVHFASAMAIMARILGIPARIGMGYLPGTVVGSRNGQTLFEVTSDQLHAWPELYFAGVGWVQFEPTVSRGSIPAYTFPGGASATSPGATSPTRSPLAVAPVPDKTNQASGSTQTTAAQELGTIVSSVLIGLFVLALLLTPAGVRSWQRRSRLRLLRDEWGSPRLAWTELRQSARDLRIAVPDTETPRAFATRIAEIIDGEADALAALDSLLEATEREEFGRPGRGMIDPDRGDELRTVLAAMATHAPLGMRARAVFLPISLLPQADQLLRGRARLTA